MNVFTVFTPIAWRERIPRGRDSLHEWRPLDTAPISLTEARAMHDRGLLLIATRHVSADVVQCVVKSPVAIIKGLTAP